MTLPRPSANCYSEDRKFWGLGFQINIIQNRVMTMTFDN
jgi:hypothetical protein